ncbi:uncharacterized protein CC84DRAFT_1167754 [Paraphaeosphaeria sporulosa]|uniref:Uncharacterized protein n=1 Tax=Paraphaeosphaeria sporulosa TaxID=1460663 RepID=A0A177C424_9PLEO|nr:uncharacterized protein CC84DRAFT_1167754 [Paraphaeosphaeria sporulosa]OAG01548.1 hypothetical protein CC84DRAFT_1167754 [Paraphaeosphaeria sporulosa]
MEKAGEEWVQRSHCKIKGIRGRDMDEDACGGEDHHRHHAPRHLLDLIIRTTNPPIARQERPRTSAMLSKSTMPLQRGSSYTSHRPHGPLLNHLLPSN